MHTLTAKHSAYLKRTGNFFYGFRLKKPLAEKFSHLATLICATIVPSISGH